MFDVAFDCHRNPGGLYSRTESWGQVIQLPQSVSKGCRSVFICFRTTFLRCARKQGQRDSLTVPKLQSSGTLPEPLILDPVNLVESATPSFFDVSTCGTHLQRIQWRESNTGRSFSGSAPMLKNHGSAALFEGCRTRSSNPLLKRQNVAAYLAGSPCFWLSLDRVSSSHSEKIDQ